MKPLLLAVLLGGCAASRPPSGIPIVGLADLSPSAAPVVLRIPAGTRLPVGVSIATPFASAEGGDPAFHVVFQRTVYWYPPQPGLVSFDGARWEQMDRLYEGRLQLGVVRTNRTGPKAFVQVAMRERP